MSSSRFALACVVLPLLAACGNKDAPRAAGTASAAATTPPAATQTAAAPRSTAASPSTAAPAGGGACSLVGAWTGTYPPGPYPFSGTDFTFTFNADGTGLTESARAKTDIAWKAEGGTLAFHGVKDVRPGRFTCGKDEIGKYAITFTPDCGSVSLKLKEDSCKGRAKTADGITINRKK